jgi:hypothetical protein
MHLSLVALILLILLVLLLAGRFGPPQAAWRSYPADAVMVVLVLVIVLLLFGLL